MKIEQLLEKGGCDGATGTCGTTRPPISPYRLMSQPMWVGQKVVDRINRINKIEKEADWPSMVSFQVEWTKRFFEIVVPLIRLFNKTYDSRMQNPVNLVNPVERKDE